MAKPEVKTETPAAPVAPPAGADDRHRLVTLDSNYKGRDGSKVKRTEFIRDCWQNLKWSRGAITKEINRLNKLSGDKEIKYQIVFAATKGIAGGPAPSAAPAAPAAA